MNVTTINEVEIGGAVWATRNVGDKGKFVDKPEDYGVTCTWEEALDACPAGWRLPTEEEIKALIDAGFSWTNVNGVNGCRFGSGENTVFLPAVGFSGCDVGLIGQYWSSTRRNAEDIAVLFFGDDYIYHPFISDDCELSGVRCVKVI